VQVKVKQLQLPDRPSQGGSKGCEYHALMPSSEFPMHSGCHLHSWLSASRRTPASPPRACAAQVWPRDFGRFAPREGWPCSPLRLLPDWATALWDPPRRRPASRALQPSKRSRLP